MLRFLLGRYDRPRFHRLRAPNLGHDRGPNQIQIHEHVLRLHEHGMFHIGRVVEEGQSFTPVLAHVALLTNIVLEIGFHQVLIALLFQISRRPSSPTFQRNPMTVEVHQESNMDQNDPHDLPMLLGQETDTPLQDAILLRMRHPTRRCLRVQSVPFGRGLSRAIC